MFDFKSHRGSGLVQLKFISELSNYLYQLKVVFYLTETK
jgi:hypothetical protein